MCSSRLSLRAGYIRRLNCTVALAVFPAPRLHRLRSAVDAGARRTSIFSYEHVTPILRAFTGCGSPERIDCKRAVPVYQCLYGLAPQYLPDNVQRVSRRLAAGVSVDIIFAAINLTYTAFHRRRSCVSGGWQPPLEQSGARRHLIRLKTYPPFTNFDWLIFFVHFLSVYRCSALLHTVRF